MCLLTGQPEVSDSSPLGESVISGFLYHGKFLFNKYLFFEEQDYEKENIKKYYGNGSVGGNNDDVGCGMRKCRYG